MESDTFGFGNDCEYCVGFPLENKQMRVAIDVSPLSSGHKVRGVGFYLTNLLSALKTYYPQHEYKEFTKKVPNTVDVVHYPYFDPFSLSLPLFKKNKTVVTVHDLTPLVFPQLFPVGLKGKAFWYLQKKRLQQVDRILTDSLSSKKDIARLANVSSAKIDSIYLSAAEHFTVVSDKQALAKIAKKYELPKSFFLYVGDVTPNKNLARLVKASLQTNAPLVMVGKALTDPSVALNHPWTMELAVVRNMAAMHPEKIRLLGFVPDEELVALYNLASAFVMPSLYEGFGLPVLEAYACGCPVITSDKGSLKEVGSAAYIVDPEDIQSIAHGMQKVIGDKQLQKRLRENGLKESKKFSWKKTAEETIQSYQKAVNQ